MRQLVVRRVHWSFATGGLLALALTGGLHLWLYLFQGYRDIPTIGHLFLLTVIASGVLAIALGLVRSVGISMVVAGFLLSVLGGYLLASTIGLFGFTETGEVTAAWLAGVGEAAGALVVGIGAIVALRSDRDRTPDPHPNPRR